MLQQTRVEAVKPYFERFMAAFPDIKALAEADDDYLMKMWEGLGYYNRARNLKAAAIMVMEEFCGQIPAEKEELLKASWDRQLYSRRYFFNCLRSPKPGCRRKCTRVLSRLWGDTLILKRLL